MRGCSAQRPGVRPTSAPGAQPERAGARHTRAVNPDERRFELMMVNESDDARLFVELSSHAADLAEARDSLELALRSMPDPDSPLRDAERSLVANATMAYCRTFFP